MSISGINKTGNKDLRIKAEFYRLTKMIPLHETNRLEERSLRKDVIFHDLAEKAFDNPKLLDLLAMKIKAWLRLSRSEFTYALAGYIYYCKDDFKRAEKYFLRAINENPRNLDNWFDLAFSLYHQEEARNNLAKKILFNFDRYYKYFRSRRASLKAIVALAEKI